MDKYTPYTNKCVFDKENKGSVEFCITKYLEDFSGYNSIFESSMDGFYINLLPNPDTFIDYMTVKFNISKVIKTFEDLNDLIIWIKRAYTSDGNLTYDQIYKYYMDKKSGLYLELNVRGIDDVYIYDSDGHLIQTNINEYTFEGIEMVLQSNNINTGVADYYVIELNVQDTVKLIEYLEGVLNDWVKEFECIERV